MAGEVSAAYCPSLPGRVAPSAGDGVRFHIPLRGSAGFAPASLKISLYSHEEIVTLGVAKISRMDGQSQCEALLRSGAFDAIRARHGCAAAPSAVLSRR